MYYWLILFICYQFFISINFRVFFVLFSTGLFGVLFLHADVCILGMQELSAKSVEEGKEEQLTCAKIWSHRNHQVLWVIC